MLEDRHDSSRSESHDPEGDRRPPERGRTDGDRRDVGRRDGGGRRDAGKGGEKRTRWPLIVLAIVVAIAVIAPGTYWYLTRNEVSTDDAYTDGRAVVIAPHVAGYVTVLAVDDNQFVHRGDLLVQIERKDYVAARDRVAGQFAAVQAQLADAEVGLEKARVTYPAQQAQAQGRLVQAQGQLFQATSEYQRQHSVARAATSQQSIDTATANLQQAQGEVQQADAQLRIAQLVPQNIASAEAQVKQLQGQVEQAKAELDQAEVNLGYTRIAAPQDGWVTRRNVEMGNYLQPGGQILAIVVPEVWVRANFKETELDRMRPGQKVRISVDAYPGLNLTGHVDSIQMGSGQKFTAFPPENATGNFVKIVQRVPVKIVIDSGLDPTLPLPLGISVVPTVTLR